MYILTANQNARVIMIIFYAHCDWLDLCAHETTQSVRSDFLPSVKMVQLVDVLLMVPMLPTCLHVANNADKIQQGQIYQSRMIQYGA